MPFYRTKSDGKLVKVFSRHESNHRRQGSTRRAYADAIRRDGLQPSLRAMPPDVVPLGEQTSSLVMRSSWVSWVPGRTLPDGCMLMHAQGIPHSASRRRERDCLGHIAVFGCGVARRRPCPREPARVGKRVHEATTRYL